MLQGAKSVFTRGFKPIRLAATLILIAAAGGCDDGGGGNQTSANDPPQQLPAEFQDSLGQRWTCPATSSDSMLSGELDISNTVTVKRADIVHLTLFEMNEDDVQQITNKCINNILNYSIAFELPYAESSINTELQYLLSARLFKLTESGDYQLTLAADGLTEVINNELFEDIEISLEPF